MPYRSLSVIAALLLSATHSFAEDAKDLKIIASAKETDKLLAIGPIVLKSRNPIVIRSAEELAMHSKHAKSANDEKVQKELSAELAKLLKVESIDWSKQMALVGVVQSFESSKAEGKTVTIRYERHVERPTRAVQPFPKVVVLVDRAEGEIKFDPIIKEDKKDKK